MFWLNQGGVLKMDKASKSPPLGIEKYYLASGGLQNPNLSLPIEGGSRFTRSITCLVFRREITGKPMTPWRHREETQGLNDASLRPMQFFTTRLNLTRGGFRNFVLW
jgi:hypothetical protein